MKPRNEETFLQLLSDYQAKFSQVTTLDDFFELCERFCTDNWFKLPLQIIDSPSESASLAKLKKYAYPEDFLYWHEHFGDKYLELSSTKIIDTKSLAEDIDSSYYELMTANKFLFITSDGSGNMYFYDVNKKGQPKIKFLDHDCYYPTDLLEELYSSVMDFYIDSETGETHNPNGLDVKKIFDKGNEFKKNSIYIHNYLLSQLEEVSDSDTFLQFLVSKTKEGLASAETEYSDLHYYHDRSWKILFNQGWDYKKNGQYELAIEAHNKSIAIEPNPEAYNGLGLVYSKLGNFQKSIDSYLQAIVLSPEYHLAYNNLAFALYRIGKFKDALEVIDKAIQIEPSDGLYQLTKAEIAFVLQEKELCYEALEAAVALGEDPRDADSSIERAYKEEKRYQKLFKVSSKKKSDKPQKTKKEKKAKAEKKKKDKKSKKDKKKKK